MFTLLWRKDRDMTPDLFLRMVGSFLMMFGGVYLMVQMIEIIEDYLHDRKLLKHLSRIEEKVDQLPGVNRVPCSLERDMNRK